MSMVAMCSVYRCSGVYPSRSIRISDLTSPGVQLHQIHFDGLALHLDRTFGAAEPAKNAWQHARGSGTIENLLRGHVLIT